MTCVYFVKIYNNVHASTHFLSLTSCSAALNNHDAMACLVRPNKAKEKFLVLLPGQFYAMQKHNDRQTDNHRDNYDGKYIHVKTVLRLNMHKNLHNRNSKIDVETQF